MKMGDMVLMYHSGEEKCVVGIAKVIREGYKDSTAPDEDWTAVDLAPLKKLKNSVSLSKIKGDPRLQEIYLVRQGRLSVMGLKKEEFDAIVELGN